MKLLLLTMMTGLKTMLFEHVVLFSARWLDYKAVGKRLFGTRFIAFKVPLKQVRLIPPLANPPFEYHFA